MKLKLGITLLLSITFNFAFSQNNVRQELEDLKNRIINMSKSLSEIQKNGKVLSNIINPGNDKMGLLSPDFLSPEIIDELKDAMAQMRENAKERRAGMIKFAGPDRNCNPGTPCFKFKKDVISVLDGIQELKSLLMIAENDNSKMLNEIRDLIGNSQPAIIYPVYVTVGPVLQSMSENIKTLTANTRELQQFTGHKVRGSGSRGGDSRPGFRRGPNAVDDPYFEDVLDDMNITSNYFSVLYMNPFGYKAGYENSSMSVDSVFSINTTYTPVQIDSSCTRDLDKVGKRINATRVVLNFSIVLSKFLQAAPDLDMEAGGSFFGHVAIGFKINPPRTVGLTIEGIAVIVDQFLGFASDNLDKCEYMLTQKIVSDNQEVILNNQKVLFEMISNMKKD